MENRLLDPRAAYSRLSEREVEVLRLLVNGISTEEMGRILCISPKTVESHRARISRKLETNSVALQTRWAIREGLIDP